MTYLNEHREHVRKEWIDYNGHMNVAYYVLVFDHGTDEALDVLGLGEKYREEQDKSFFVVESHITYDNEVKLNDPLVVKTRLLGYDNKRLHLFHEMYHAQTGEKCATNEIMALHVDMVSRKTTPISQDFAGKLQSKLDESLKDGFPQDCGRSVRRLI